MSTGKPRLFDGGWWLFLLLMAVYLLSYSGAFHAINEVSVVGVRRLLATTPRVARAAQRQTTRLLILWQSCLAARLSAPPP